MTRRDALDKVFAGMRAAEAAGLTPIKINCVVIGGTNDDEVVDFALVRATGYEVRFIEYMPLDAQHAWEREKVVPSARILAAIDAVHPLLPEGHATRAGDDVPLRRRSPGTGRRDRLRHRAVLRHLQPTPADGRGQFRNCLFAMGETDLRGADARGASDDDLALLIRQGLWTKWSGHRINHPDFVQPARSMSMIGG